jgi:hypothetical protein
MDLPQNGPAEQDKLDTPESWPSTFWHKKMT